MTTEDTRGPGSLETWTLAQLAAWLKTEEARRIADRTRGNFERQTGKDWKRTA